MIKKVLLLSVIIYIHTSCFSQQDLTFHFLRQVSQSNNTNPAFPSICKVGVGIPIISSNEFHLNNSFTFNDIVNKLDNSSFSLDLDNVMNIVDETSNYLNYGYNTDIIRASYKHNDVYEFNFNITEHIDYKQSYSKDYFRIAGLILDKKFFLPVGNFSGSGVLYQHYREYGFGMVRTPNEQFTLGVRAKLLFGKSNVFLENNDYQIYIDSASFGVKTNIAPNVHSAGLDLNYNIVSSNNMGVGIDLGFTYSPIKSINFSGSIIDLGQIKWNYNIKNYEVSGVELIDKAKVKSFSTDSVFPQAKIDTTQTPYKSQLPTKIYASGTFEPFEGTQVGLLFFGEVVNKNFYPAYTFEVQQKLKNHFSVIMTYSYYNNEFNNIGCGIAIGSGPTQFYAVTDNIHSLLYAGNSKNFGGRFGINLLFGVEGVTKKKAPVKGSWMSFLRSS